MSEKSDAIADEIFQRSMQYVHRKRLRIPFNATRPDFQTALRQMSAWLENFDPMSLFPDGAVKDHLNPLHARKYMVAMLRAYHESDRSRLEAYEDTLRSSSEGVPGNSEEMF